MMRWLPVAAGIGSALDVAFVVLQRCLWVRFALDAAHFRRRFQIGVLPKSARIGIFV